MPAFTLQEERFAVVLDWLQQHNARSALDLGCGSGDLLAYLDDLSRLDHIVGVDVREDALAHTRDSLSQSMDAGDGRIGLVHGSFTDATLPLQGFRFGLLQAGRRRSARRVRAEHETGYRSIFPGPALIPDDGV